MAVHLFLRSIGVQRALRMNKKLLYTGVNANTVIVILIFIILGVNGLPFLKILLRASLIKHVACLHIQWVK